MSALAYNLLALRALPQGTLTDHLMHAIAAELIADGAKAGA